MPEVRQHRVRDPALLRARHQVVDQHAESPGDAGPELGDGLRQVVQAIDRLHDDAFHPQVVAPDPFDQRRVVDALHPDPGGSRGTGPQTRDDPGTGCGHAAMGGTDRGRTRVTCSPSTRNAPGSSGNSRRRPALSSRVTTVDEQFTAAPQNPESGSSATTSAVAGTSGIAPLARPGSQHVAAVSVRVQWPGAGCSGACALEIAAPPEARCPAGPGPVVGTAGHTTPAGAPAAGSAPGMSSPQDVDEMTTALLSGW